VSRHVSENVLLTGLPRSGTTLSCELLNKLPDTVALHEPMRMRQLDGEGVSAGSTLAERVERFMRDARRSLLEEGRAPSKQVAGRITGVNVSEPREVGGERRKLARWGEIRVQRPLTPGFLLAIKHNSPFAATLPELRELFPVFALVRNPLALLISWQTVPFPIGRGRQPAGEHHDAQLRDALDVIPGVVDRQMHVLRWFFERFASLPRHSVIRYEDVIASGGRALAAITPAATQLDEPLQLRDAARLVDPQGLRRLGERLLQDDGPQWSFYERDEVAVVMAAIEERSAAH